jgi:hypothetical protein
MNANALEEDVTTYTFELNGETYQGYCWEVTFADSDEVTVAYQVYDRGFQPPKKLQVADKEVTVRDYLALIRPSIRSIWIIFHVFAGSNATKKEAIQSFKKGGFWYGIGMAMLMFVAHIAYPEDFKADSLKGKITEFFTSFLEMFELGGSVFILVVIPIYADILFFTRKIIFELSKIGDEIFSAFGFSDPCNFDLVKTSRERRKIANTPISDKDRFHLWY